MTQNNQKIKITICNWREYQPRTDLKSMAWFRIESNISEHPAFFRMDSDGKWFFIFLLSQCAKKNTDSLNTDLNYLEYYSKVEAQKILQMLSILHESVLIRYELVTNSCPTLHNNTLQTLHNNTNITKQTIKICASAKADTPLATKFIKPTLLELENYIQEKKYVFKAEDFYNYYESNGWRVGRNPMKCWHAACANWNKNKFNKKSTLGETKAEILDRASYFIGGKKDE